jgi:hypothetical protein
MSNNTTKADREIIVKEASKRLRMDTLTQVTNWVDVEIALIVKFGISRQRARTAVATASRRKRGAILEQQRKQTSGKS